MKSFWIFIRNLISTEFLNSDCDHYMMLIIYISDDGLDFYFLTAMLGGLLLSSVSLVPNIQKE